MAERPAESLFTVDSHGSEHIQKQVRKAHKTLKADEILAQRSLVPAVDTRSRAGKVSNGIIEPRTKRRRVDLVDRRTFERLQSTAYRSQSMNDVMVSNKSTHDLWAPAALDEDSRLNFLEKPRPIQMPETLKRPPVSLIEKARSVAPVSKPKAGQSYNPAFEDWDAMIQRAGEEAVSDEQKRLEREEQERDFAARAAASGQNVDESNILRQDEDSVWEGFESDYDHAAEIRAKRPGRKTPQERKKAERKKERAREEKAAAKERERRKRENQIDQLKAEVIARTKLTLQPVHDSSSEEEEITKLRRRRFGKHAVPPASLDLVLPDDLRDSLRALKPEGNMLLDRFRNILVRGKVETRRPAAHTRKKRRALTEKWTHKDFDLHI